MALKFWRYHALGNDYLVMDRGSLLGLDMRATALRICDRHFGVGSDGILVNEGSSSSDTFSLRIVNPDGSEAEKSGNGLRIFARFLFDQGLVTIAPFKVMTAGGEVLCRVLHEGKTVQVDMGAVSFVSSEIPVRGERREVLHEELEVGGRKVSFCAATVGNPHCVVLDAGCLPEEAMRLGPLVEVHPLFPNRTNVQFLRVLDRKTIQIEIWERGAGYTLASGSSASASAAVARRLGLVDDAVRVVMPGGTLDIAISPEYKIRMTGPVTRVAEGVIDPECLG